MELRLWGELTMSNKFYLFVRVAEACLISFIIWLTLALLFSGLKISSNHVVSTILLATWLYLGCGFATWWIFRKLKLRYSKLEAMAVATAFALFTPVALLTSAFFDQVLGVYIALPLDHIFRSRTGIFEAIGTIISLPITTTLLSFSVCVFVLWMTRHIQKLQKHNQLTIAP